MEVNRPQSRVLLTDKLGLDGVCSPARGILKVHRIGRRVLLGWPDLLIQLYVYNPLQADDILYLPVTYAKQLHPFFLLFIVLLMIFFRTWKK